LSTYEMAVEKHHDISHAQNSLDALTKSSGPVMPDLAFDF
jgi:hypothetical protein